MRTTDNIQDLKNHVKTLSVEQILEEIGSINETLKTSLEDIECLNKKPKKNANQIVAHSMVSAVLIQSLPVYMNQLKEKFGMNK